MFIGYLFFCHTPKVSSWYIVYELFDTYWKYLLFLCIVLLLSNGPCGKYKKIAKFIFPNDSVGQESAFNAGDPGLIPRSGRFPGEGNRHLLQYSCLGKSHGHTSLGATVHRVTGSRTHLSNSWILSTLYDYCLLFLP